MPKSTSRRSTGFPRAGANPSQQSRGRPTNREWRFNQLSETRQRLVEIAHAIGFGWIEGLPVEGGEPRVSSRRRTVSTLKFGSPSDSIPELTPTSTLKVAWSELFVALDELGTGEIERLEVHAGLPTRAVVEVTIPDSK